MGEESRHPIADRGYILTKPASAARVEGTRQCGCEAGTDTRFEAPSCCECWPAAGTGITVEAAAPACSSSRNPDCVRYASRKGASVRLASPSWWRTASCQRHQNSPRFRAPSSVTRPIHPDRWGRQFRTVTLTVPERLSAASSKPRRISSSPTWWLVTSPSSPRCSVKIRIAFSKSVSSCGWS